ncbi:DNA-binding response regulator [Synergistales bacterium]|nr:DNA-binding response regulator [Synergistales bacterium]
MRTLLCVEDEKTLLKNNREFFEKRGFRVLAAENLKQAREHLAAEKPDAILLDIMLPDGNGLDLLQELRGAGNKVPVIMLTAWGEPKDVSRGYLLGATAYLSKPFDYDAVEAAIEGIFNSMEQMPEVIQKASLTLKLSSMMAFVNGKDVLLTGKEFALLLLFAQNEGRTMSAEYIYEKVWGQEMIGEVRALKKRISDLRGKIEGSGYAINPIRDAGYRFEREEPRGMTKSPAVFIRGEKGVNEQA